MPSVGSKQHQSRILQRKSSNIAIQTAANDSTAYAVPAVGSKPDMQRAKETGPQQPDTSAALCDTASELHRDLANLLVSEDTAAVPAHDAHAVQTVSIPGQVDAAEHRSDLALVLSSHVACTSALTQAWESCLTPCQAPSYLFR